MKLPFFHVLTESKYRQQLEASYKEGYKTAWSCCYTGQYQRMTDDEKELKILYLSNQNEILTEKLLSLDRKINKKLIWKDYKMKDRQYYFGDPRDIWRVFFSEKAPCAHCDFRYSCASKHWACSDLAQYLRTGEVVDLIREPTPGRYSVIFGLKSEEKQK